MSKSRSCTRGPCNAAYVDGFAADLKSTGYNARTIDDHVRGILHLGWWADAHRVTLSQIDERVVNRFIQHLSRCRCSGPYRRRCRRVKCTARLFLSYLRRQGFVSPAPERIHANTSALLSDFHAWMVRYRSVSSSTADKYVSLLRHFVNVLGEDPKQYQAAQVRTLILKCTVSRSRSFARSLAQASRALLRFLAVEGRCAMDLTAAVPRIPQWRLSALPRYLQTDEVERVINSCDLSKPLGLRDRAILLLLARLGLRAGEVIALRLDDLDWERGTIRVRSKGGQEAILPLPQSVGDAILDYLQRARPRVTIDRVFLCVQAPYRSFSKSSSVSNIVRFALRRAGIQNPPSFGAHLLRHSAATTMLRAGGTLEAISTVLRHKSVETTAIYAKVDTKMLQYVVQPWPKEAP